MKNFTKKTYLLLATFSLAANTVHTTEQSEQETLLKRFQTQAISKEKVAYFNKFRFGKDLERRTDYILNPLTPWLRKAIQDLWLADEEKLNQVFESQDIYWRVRVWYFIHMHMRIASVLMRYNHQKIDWKNKAFWANPALKNQLIQDILYQDEVLHKIDSEKLIEDGCFDNNNYFERLFYKYDLPADWHELASPFDCQEAIIHRSINHEKLPQDPHHSYLYDIIAKDAEDVPYLKELPRTVSSIKTLLTFLWHHHKAYPYALVHYTDPDSGEAITQAPWTFIASFQFDQIVLENYRIWRSMALKKGDENFQLDSCKAELIELYLASPIPITKELLPQSPIMIANNELKKLPDPIAAMIAEYVGLEPDVNAVDSYGHTALDYVQQATQPLTYQALQAHGATHHKPLSWYQRNKHAISTCSSKYASAMVEVSKDTIESPVTWLLGGTLFLLGVWS